MKRTICMTLALVGVALTFNACTTGTTTTTTSTTSASTRTTGTAGDASGLSRGDSGPMTGGSYGGSMGAGPR